MRTSLFNNKTLEEKSLLVFEIFSKVSIQHVRLVIRVKVAMTIQRADGQTGRWEASKEMAMDYVGSRRTCV